VDLLKSQEINLDYILELIFEHNKKTKKPTNHPCRFLKL